MKSLFIYFFAGLWLGVFSLNSQTEEAAIPSEVSDPPYQVGDLVSEQGYYIERGDEYPKINLRIVDKKLRLYWIDADGLIAEPEYDSATVRFTGSVRGRPYHRLGLLPKAAGLGAEGFIYPPHIFSVILVFSAVDGEEPVSHNFRYTPSMDVETDPTADTEN